MRLEFSFENLDEIKRVYDPAVVEKATAATIKQLQAKAATQVSRAVRGKYAVSASAVKSVLKPRIRKDGGIHTGYLIYLSRRISLRHFATSSPRPKVKTRRGVRYGARVKVRKDQRAQIVPGAFWGKARTSGADQIFQRIGPGRLKVRKLTAPAIAQMVRSEAAIDAINDLVRQDADRMLAHNLDHFLLRQIGAR